MSTMFSSCVSIDESRRPVACTTELRPTSTERSCVTDTVSCAWNGYGRRHWKPASTVWLYLPKEVTTACWPSCTMKKPLPSQPSTTTAPIRPSTDAGALHVGLEAARPPPPSPGHAAVAAVAAARRRTGR
jgi:hypothetical protein